MRSAAGLRSWFSIWLGLVLIMALPSTSPARAADTTHTLQVMTYNIRTGRAMDGLDAWPLRKHRTLALIQKYHPDVLGLQEALDFQLTYLQENMPGYAIVGSGRNDGRTAGEFSAIMYRTDRLQLLESKTFWLSATPDVPATTTWGNKIVRICTWAHFHDRATGKDFYHFNTHFDHISQPSREQSAKLMLERIAAVSPKAPVIATGDFNAGEQNPAVKTMLAGGFVDSFRAVHPKEKRVGTTNAFKARSNNKIDYIFVDSNWTVEAAGIHADKIEGRWPSDHLPVTARLLEK